MPEGLFFSFTKICVGEGGFELKLSGSIKIFIVISKCNIKLIILALADVAQWIECWPANPKVAGSVPTQSTRLG